MGLISFSKKLIGLSYDGVKSTPRRKNILVSHKSEDRELPVGERAKAVSCVRDLLRNNQVARWCLNKHLDFTTNYHFQSKTGIADFDRQLETLVTWWSRPKNCDSTGRNSFSALIRLIESLRASDGDSFLVLNQDGTLTGIESDRIRDWEKAPIPPGGKQVQGVLVDANGKPVGYCLHYRGEDGQFVFDRVLDASYVIVNAHITRFDQYRGISSFMPSLNAWRDLEEAQEFTLVRMKIQSLIGVKYTTQPSDGLDDGGIYDDEPRYLENVKDENGNPVPAPDGPRTEWGKGITDIELDEGENAEFMESAHPTTQYQTFLQSTLLQCLKALSIPLSFYDESLVNFSSSRSAWINYNASAEVVRQRLRENILYPILDWKIATWVASGMLKLPPEIKYVSDINYEFVSETIPYLNPSQEVSANIAAINANLTSRTQVCKERGQDFDEIIADLRKENKAIQEMNGNKASTV